MTTRELCIYKFNELLTGLNKSDENINFDDTSVLSSKIVCNIIQFNKDIFQKYAIIPTAK